jgi:hypothetical protein
MSDLHQRYVRLLKFYPKAYREQRGDEILATLMEASPSDREHPALGDAVDIALHGVQMRLGLSSDRFAGRVLEVAAAPGLAIAAAFSVFLFVCAELFPFLNHAYGMMFVLGPTHPVVVPRPHFGPFATTGAVIYVGWVVVATGALLWPTHRRSLATLGVILTLVTMVVGRTYFAAPRVSLVLVLVALGLPAVVAPTTEFARRRLTESAIAFGISLGILAWSSRGLIAHEAQDGSRLLHSFGSLYTASIYNLGSVLYPAGTLAVIGIVTLVVLRRPVAAGAVALLLAPWLLVAYTYHVQNGRTLRLYALLLGIPLLLLTLAWIVDVARPTSSRNGPAFPTS